MEPQSKEGTMTTVGNSGTSTSSTSCSNKEEETTSQKRSLTETSPTSNGDPDTLIPDAKKPKVDNDTPAATNNTSTISTKETQDANNVEKSAISMIDVCATLMDSNNNPITRIQVKWDLHVDDPPPISENSNSETNTETNITPSNQMEIWWGATILPHDGSSYHILHDTDDQIKVPIRTLDYDPYPSLGFTEPELAQVVFTNDHSCMDIQSNQSFWFRMEGSDWTEKDVLKKDESGAEESVSLLGEEGLSSILDTVLTSTFDNHPVIQQKFQKLSRAQQCHISDKIRHVKEKMVQKLMQSTSDKGREITPEQVKQCMDEIGMEMMQAGGKI